MKKFIITITLLCILHAPLILVSNPLENEQALFSSDPHKSYMEQVVAQLVKSTNRLYCTIEQNRLKSRTTMIAALPEQQKQLFDHFMQQWKLYLDTKCLTFHQQTKNGKNKICENFIIDYFK